VTIPSERKSAVLRTEKFLVSLCDPKQTPRVPSAVREEARRLLKHYPSGFHMDQASEQAPEVFGDNFN